MENIYLPETIKVGYQKRGDTYSGQLAYVIYIDEKGKVRKEGSWNSWRDEKIEPNDFKNEPIEGFVLNKKVGGYSSGWDHRQTYTRVYDPRGFEFEITIENLLYILENSSCIKGKGLEGKFVYGWQGKDLILIPCDSPDYDKLSSFSKQIQNYKQTKVKAKDLIFGAVYRNKQNEDLVYMDRMDEYCDYYGRLENHNRYFFYNLKTKSFITYSSPSVLIGLTDGTPVENYAELMDNLLGSTMVSPIEPTKDEFIDLSLDEAIKIVAESSFCGDIYGEYEGKIVNITFDSIKKINPIDEESFYINDDEDFDGDAYIMALVNTADKLDTYRVYEIREKGNNYNGYGFGKTIYNSWSNNGLKINGTVEELHNKFKLKKIKQYLKNGNEKR